MLKLSKKYIVALAAVIVAVVAASLLPPQVLRLIVDNYLLAGRMEGLLTMGLLYLGSFALVGLFDFLKGWLLTTVGQIIVKNVRSEMQRKLNRLPASYFTKNSGGRITSKFINDVDNISVLFTSGVISMAIDCFKIVGIIVSIWIFSSAMGFFALCLIPVIGLLTWFFKTRMLRSQKANLIELGKVNNHIGESIRNILMIKAFHKEKYMEGRYKTYLTENYRTMNQVNFYDSCYSPIIQVMTACSIGFILYLAAGGSGNLLGISIGQLTASVNLITNLFSPIDSLGTELSAIQKGMSGIDSVKDFLSQPEETEKETYEELVDTDIELEFQNVSFAYEEGRDVIQGFNLKVCSGDHVVLTGRTGVGKSTLLKLAAGILQPDKGSVKVNGVDTFRIAASQKRKIFGYVQQDFSFIKGNIWDQIRLGDASIEKEAVIEAIEFVGLKEVIDSLEQGYDTPVAAELFSQGQKQLLAVARAIAAGPKILLLDEITANLDTATEEKIMKVLKKAGGGRTILSIAHRQAASGAAERKIKL